MEADPVKNFVIVGHGNVETVKSMLEANPAFSNAGHEWRPGQLETVLQGAADRNLELLAALKGRP